MRLSFFGETNVGRQRDHNEDSLLVLCDLEKVWQEVNNLQISTSDSKGIIFVVVDGMGGANAGEIASEIAVKTVKEEIEEVKSVPNAVEDFKKLLIALALKGHTRILRETRRNKELQGMGTTIILGWIYIDTLFIVWSGDSRCYIYNKSKDKELIPFTDDHSLVWEMVKNNQISAEEARISDESNLILQSLGGSLQKPDPGFKSRKLEKNDRIVICSDGLNSMLSDIGIQQILDFGTNPKETCQSLIEAANNAGGHDNITSIVIDVLEDENSAAESVVTEERKNKKISLKRLGFILPVLLILTGFIFRGELASVFKSLSSSKIGGLADSTLLEDINDSNSLEGKGFVTQTFDSTLDETNHSNLISLNEISPSQKPLVKIDSNHVENALNKALDDIIRMKTQISIALASDSKSLTNENALTLDSIFHKLIDLENQITTVTSYNKVGHKISNFEVKDYTKANEVCLEIQDAVDDLKEKLR